jgi:hypothetical protein
LSGSDLRRVDPEIVAEFYLWLWWRGSRDEDLDLDGIGPIRASVDDRVALIDRQDRKCRSVLSGGRSPAVPEAPAALLGGKLPAEVRVVLRRKDTEFTATLKGEQIDLSGLRVPALTGDEDEVAKVLDRMALLEEASDLLGALFQRFAAERLAPDWSTTRLPAIQRWIAELRGAA